MPGEPSLLLMVQNTVAACGKSSANESTRFLVEELIEPITREPDMRKSVTAVGMIVSKDKTGKSKPGKPFKIGSSSGFIPKNDGLLFFRFNLPPEQLSATGTFPSQ
jgi:hypothetical protein